MDDNLLKVVWFVVVVFWGGLIAQQLGCILTELRVIKSLLSER